MTALPAEQEEQKFAELEFQQQHLLLDVNGCLFWPQERLLIVSDLHLEKGSSFASRKGVFVPPYDTTQTLSILQRSIAQWQPKTIVSLGDSFHDEHAYKRLPHEAQDSLQELMCGREWIWISGNHDPSPPKELGGIFSDALQLGPFNFTHEPLAEYRTGEIAGHLHPCAKIRRRGRSVRRRCLIGDGNRLIMPAFGAFTGGLNVRDEAYHGLFDKTGLNAWMISDTGVYKIAGKHLIK